MHTLHHPDQQFQFEDSSLSIWKMASVAQLFSEIIIDTKTEEEAPLVQFASQKKHLTDLILQLSKQKNISQDEWREYFGLFYQYNSWDLSEYNNETLIAFVCLTEQLFQALLEGLNQELEKEMHQVFEMHLGRLSTAIEVDQTTKGSWREVLIDKINNISTLYLNTVFYKAFIRQNEYTKATALLPPDDERDAYVSREHLFMDRLSIGMTYTKLFDFWGLLNINSKTYIDTVLQYLEEIVLVGYETWSKFGAAKSKVKPILYYYYKENEYARQQLTLLLKRLEKSKDSNATLLLKDIQLVLSKIDQSKTLDLSRFDQLIETYQQIGLTQLSTQNIKESILKHRTIFEFKATDFYNLSIKNAFVINELLDSALGLRKYSSISIYETEKYSWIKEALNKVDLCQGQLNNIQSFWLNLFTERAEQNIKAYELAQNADSSKILTIAQDLFDLKIIPNLPNEQEVQEIIFDSNPKQKKKIVKDLLKKMGVIIHFDAETGFSPLPYDDLNALLHFSARQDIPELKFITKANLFDLKNQAFEYEVFYVYKNTAFLFKEESSSDYYSNNFVPAFNKILSACGVKKQFIEQKTSDQTYCFYYMEPKQLDALNDQYKLFKKKK